MEGRRFTRSPGGVERRLRKEARREDGGTKLEVMSY